MTFFCLTRAADYQDRHKNQRFALHQNTNLTFSIMELKTFARSIVISDNRAITVYINLHSTMHEFESSKIFRVQVTIFERYAQHLKTIGPTRILNLY